MAVSKFIESGYKTVICDPVDDDTMPSVTVSLLKLLLAYLCVGKSLQDFTNLYIPSEHSDGKITVDFCNQLVNSDGSATSNREPVFLTAASTEDKKQFCHIVLNTQLTKAEIQQQLRNWVKNQNATVQEAFSAATNSTAVLREQIQVELLNLTNNLSPEIKQLVQQINTVSNNMQLTPTEEMNQVKTLLNSTADIIRSELWPKIMELEVKYHKELVFPLSAIFASNTNPPH